MIEIVKSIRTKLLQFSNFWYGLKEKTRQVILVVFPLLSGLILTVLITLAYKPIENYFGARIYIFWFVVCSVVMFIFAWLFALIIDERRKMEEQTCRDYLTGVYTRRFTYEEAIKMAAQASRANQVICVCFVDLDNLKPINDLYSHAAGDEALILVGRTLLEAIRINDLVGRYGGDEFLLIWTTEDEKTIDDTFKRIIAALSHMSFMWQGKEIFITASTGRSHGFCPPKSDPEKTLKDLIRQADNVLKVTKKYNR